MRRDYEIGRNYSKSLRLKRIARNAWREVWQVKYYIFWDQTAKFYGREVLGLKEVGFD